MISFPANRPVDETRPVSGQHPASMIDFTLAISLSLSLSVQEYVMILSTMKPYGNGGAKAPVFFAQSQLNIEN